MHDDLIKFINSEVSLDPSHEIGGSTDLLLTGLVDSLGVIDVVAWIEDNLGFRIDPGDITLENFQTVDLMVAYIGRRQAEAS